MAKLSSFLLALLMLLPIESEGVTNLDTRTGNPLVPGYFADPCLRKYGDTYYLYVTPDGWGVGEGPFCIWTSKDFVHWTANKSNWPTTNNKWAPSVVFRNNLYYMYTQVPCQVWVGTSSSPLGPWTNPISGGGCMIPDQTPSGTITLDGEVFIDDDGQAYMYYGTWWTPTVVKLNSDMVSTVSGSAIQFFSHTGYTPPNGTVTGCMEAPYMFKRNGKYYYMYSDYYCDNSTYQVEYSVGDSPLGPWTYGANNPILSTNLDDTVDGPGHNSILEDGGKVYIVYHRHDNPHSAGGAHRQTCVDELHFNADGSIEKVVPSHAGVGFLAPSTVKDTNIAVGKPATASTYYSADFLPEFATDENNGTLWKASSYTYPQWLTVDLGSAKSFKRVQTEFQFPQVAYKYRIEYSTNGTTWYTFVDRSSNTNWGPMVDSVSTAVTGRYVRITMTGDGTPSRPTPEIGIWGIKVYDGVDKTNQAPMVEAGPDVTGSTSFLTLPLKGAVVDDGLPSGPVTTTWSKQSGPGTVTFKNADRCETTATFSAAGTYVLKLDANDGALSSFDTVTYNITAPGDKLVCYGFDEPRGVLVADSSGNAQDGYLENHAKRGMGAIGRAAAFDGVDDYVYVPALTTPTALTISAWVKLDTLSDYSSIVCGNGSATGTPFFSVRGTGEVQFSVIGCSPADQKSTYKFTEKMLGRWVHVAVTYDKSAKSAKFYINGKLDATKSYTTVQTLKLNIGSRCGGWDGSGRYLTGKIDEFKMYNRALSATEIATLASGVSFATIGDAKKLADGQSITLVAKPVTYAPRYNNQRWTDSFYIEEADRSAALRVEDGGTPYENATEDKGLTMTGVMRTNPSTYERYLELSPVACESESAPVASPVLATTKSVQADKKILGVLVEVAAKVVSIAPDRMSMTIKDGYLKNRAEVLTDVVSECATIGTEISVGNTVSVVGVVSQTVEGRRNILLRGVRRLVPAVPPITNGLVAWYKFDEGTGTSASDSSGNGKTATLTNGPTWVAGRLTKAVNLDGVDDHVRLPNAIVQGLSDFTICTWVKLDGTAQWSRIFDFGSGTGSYMFLCCQNGIGLRYAIQQPSTSEQVLDYNTPMPTGAWKHVAVTQSGNTVTIYIDGKSVAQSSSFTYRATNLGATTQDYIGKSQYGDPLLDGAVDDFRIYNRALTAAEISQLAAGY